MDHSIIVNGHRVMVNGYGVWERKLLRKILNGKVCTRKRV